MIPFLCLILFALSYYFWRRNERGAPGWPVLLLMLLWPFLLAVWIRWRL